MGSVVEVERLSDGAPGPQVLRRYRLGRKRLVREARILAGFEHPHLLPVVGRTWTTIPPTSSCRWPSGTLEAELRRGGDL